MFGAYVTRTGEERVDIYKAWSAFEQHGVFIAAGVDDNLYSVARQMPRVFFRVC